MPSTIENHRKKLTLLYVEPDAGYRRITGSFLRRYYGEVLTSSTGEEGVEFMIKYHPSIILTDFYLGRINGLEFLSEIKQFSPGSRVIFYTDNPSAIAAKVSPFPVISRKKQDGDLLVELDQILFQPKRRTRRPGAN